MTKYEQLREIFNATPETDECLMLPEGFSSRGRSHKAGDTYITKAGNVGRRHKSSPQGRVMYITIPGAHTPSTAPAAAFHLATGIHVRYPNQVAHLCHNCECVNPRHLAAGTRAMNQYTERYR